jgi:bifunctional DNA-binding transcriptional regulator/antitoxin component of YhaV-PrlF toxin-antitoxin module
MVTLLVKLRVKAMRVGNSVRVAVPSEIRRVAGIEEGDELLMDYDEVSHKVTLEKK